MYSRSDSLAFFQRISAETTTFFQNSERIEQIDMMAKSRLSHKVLLCNLLEELDEPALLDVVPLISHDLGFENLNSLLIKVLMKWCDTITIDSMIKMENIIRDTIKMHNSKASNDCEKEKDNKSRLKRKRGKLLRMPTDLIIKTSIFLNETDIFNFEQCCRLFYQITNNLPYLNQSNNFKIFDLTQNRLSQMAKTQEKKYDFFKYSTAKTFIFSDVDWLEYATHLDTFVRRFETKWKKVQAGNVDDNKWLTNMWKSIKSLNLGIDGTILFYALPIDILFNPNESQLETVTLNHFWHSQSDYCNQLYNKFEQQYLDLKNKFENQGKQIQVLKCIKHDNKKIPKYNKAICHQIECIESKHVWVNNGKIDLSNWICNSNGIININKSCLSMVTFERNACFSNYNKNDNYIKSNKNNNVSLSIETLRLVDMFDITQINDICGNETLIESLNLHNSLFNMTLHATISSFGINCQELTKKWEKIICSLLTKSYFYNLKNVNILLELDCQELWDWIFQILKINQIILKHQFEQLNIGLCDMSNTDRDQEQCHILQWNSKIDEKFLKQFDTKCNTLYQKPSEREANLEKYVKWKKMWL